MRISKLALNRVLILFVAVLSCAGLKSQINPKGYSPSQSIGDKFIVINKTVRVTNELVYEKEVLLYPGAFIETTGSGKVIFANTFTVFGDYQVFDKKINIEFRPGTVSSLSPTWFGAKGNDEVDDTEALQKLFKVASSIPNAIRIDVPIGKFLFSTPISIESTGGEKSVLHVQGISSSNSGSSGSSFLWNGARGASMFVVKNISYSIFENLDFNAVHGKFPKHNMEMRPYTNQVTFLKCSFGGCAGEESYNINLNEGNADQVSEITFENCLFRGVRGNNETTFHAVKGGWGNTKDFYFRNCSLGPYLKEAIFFRATDVLVVEGCTFFENDIDISCETCKSYIVSNYSEGSAAFWSSTASSNFNATTLINNQFTGVPKDGFVIRDGSGTLILLNNNFGAGNYNDDKNRVRWEENEYSTIYSAGNVFKNSDATHPAFYNRSNTPYNVKYIESVGDLGGVLGEGRKRLSNVRRN